MAFPATDLLTRVEAAPGADLTADPSTWVWVDISRWARGEVSIHRGREDTNGVVGSATCTLRLANEDSRFTFDHPLGVYWPDWRRGTPIRVSLNPGSGWVTRFTGELRVCDPVWPSGNSDIAEVQVVAKDGLQRIGRGKVLDSPLRRALLRDAVAPVAYWTMEDGSTATSFGSAVGGPPISFSDMRPGGDSTILGSAPLPTAGTTANWSGPVPPYPASSQWTVCFPLRLPAAPTVKTGLMAWSTSGPIQKWVLTLTPGTNLLTLEAYNTAGTEVLGDTGATFNVAGVDLYGQQLFVRVTAKQNGADIAWGYDCYNGQGVTSHSGTLAATQIGNVGAVYHSAFPGLTAGGYTIGHVTVAPSTAFAAGATSVAASGWTGERATSRVRRLLKEERIANNIPAGIIPGTGGARLGPQQRATALDLLRLVEATENGLLFVGTDGVWRWTDRASRYNRTPTLALDVARGHVKLPFQPAGDDQRLKNDVTVSNVGGGTASYSDVDVRDGSYTGPLTVNYADDSSLLYRAQWEKHAGTVEELRIPTLPIILQSSPDLIGQWLATDIGDWLTVDNLPRQYPPGRAGLVLEGYTETFDAVTWSATLNGSPSRLWEAFQVGHDRLGRLDTAGSQLTAGVSVGATSLSVQTTSGPLWITTANRSQDLPPTRQFSVKVHGLEVPVTAITSIDPTLVGVGASAAGNAASVTPALPGGIVAGDLLLCYAGCRNDAAGTTTLPAGWTTLVSLNGTAKLMGKVATGADTAPVVAFSGLAAGDTTIGQCAAFRNVNLTAVPGNLNQLNASAQNIAYPAVGVPTDTTALLLYLGWKPSAWTSVATLAGATEVGEPSSALGSGMGLVWDYAIQKGTTSIQAGSFTVTGGVAAASRGAVVALASTNIQTFTVAPTPMAFSAGEPVTSWRPGYVAL